jgi:hypothetical protein
MRAQLAQAVCLSAQADREKSPSFRWGSNMRAGTQNGRAVDTRHSMLPEYVVGRIIPITCTVSLTSNALRRPHPAVPLGARQAANQIRKVPLEKCFSNDRPF